MKSTGKAAIAAAATLAVLGAGVVGAGAWSGQQAERELQALVASASGRDGVRMMNLKHERGLLSSTGSVDLRIEETCGETPANASPLTVQVQYRLQHLPLPGSAMRFDWSLAPTGEAGAVFARTFGQTTKLQGEGTVGFDGHLQSTLALPELAMSGAESVQVAPSTGRVRWGKNSFGLDWQTDRVVVRGGGQALELQKLALAMDLTNRKLGAGVANLTIDKLSTGFGSAEGFGLRSEVIERGDRVDMKFTPSLRKLDAGGQSAKDLVLEVGLAGVHAQSLETLGRIAGETCGFEQATADETAKVRGALRTLMARGFTLGIPRIAGTVGGGSLEGNVQVKLEATPGGDNAPILLARVLRSSGQLTLKGDAIGAEQKQMALAMGVATEVPGGLQAGYDYADGLLKANGRSFDAGGVQAALAHADQAINAFLSSNEPIAVALRGSVPAAAAPDAEDENDSEHDEVDASAPATTPAALAPQR